MSYEQNLRERRRLLDAGRRRWLDDDDDLDVATHEAGHIVAGWWLHLNPTSATINGGDGYGGNTCFGRALCKRTDCDQAFAQCVVRMAGVEAERLFGGPDDYGGKTDLVEAHTLVRSFCRSEAEMDVVIDSARSTARTMLKAHLGPLIAITTLITERTLDRNQINAIINPDDDDGGGNAAG
jgi:hypothetical protein